MTHDPNTALLSAALQAADRGWPVIPLHPGLKRPAGHPERSCPKTGRCHDGHRTPEQRATTDPALIRAAWATRPYNVGVATGPAGLIVIDLDLPKPNEPIGAPDGATSLLALCERAGQAVPTTYRVRTASGGAHLYFTPPAGVRLGNSAGRLGTHIDTRAWGGYVLAAGSVVGGQAYEVTDPAPVAGLPAWLLYALAPEPAPAQPVHIRTPRFGNRVADAALDREISAVRAAVEGGRNTQLLRSARAMGRFVAWGDLPRHQVEDAFQGAGESTGLPDAECRATIRSALNWSIRNCRPRGTAA